MSVWEFQKSRFLHHPWYVYAAVLTLITLYILAWTFIWPIALFLTVVILVIGSVFTLLSYFMS